MKFKPEMERNIIQILRGIAISMVVLHHVIYASTPSDWAISFVTSFLAVVHVPLFFIISGWLYQKNEFKYAKMGIGKFVWKKFKQLMVPYFIFCFMFSIAILTLDFIPMTHELVKNIIGENEVKSFVRIIVDTVLFREMYFKSLWYLYSLFILLIFMYTIKSERIKGVNVIVVLLLTIAYKALCWKWYSNDNCVVIDGILSSAIYLLLGRYCYIRYSKGFVIRKGSILLSVLCIILYITRVRFIDLKTILPYYGRAFWMQIELWLVRVAFLLIILAIARFFHFYDNNKNIIKRIGDYSYSIYLLHNPWIVSVVCMFVGRKLPWGPGLIISWMTIVVASVFIADMIKKWFPQVYSIAFGTY